MKRIIVIPITIIFFIFLVGCTQKSRIENLPKPKTISTYYDNISSSYTYGISIYEEGYEKLRKIKIKSSSHEEFLDRAMKVQSSVDDSLLVYYDAMEEQLRYSIATNLDPQCKVLNSLEDLENKMEMAEEKFEWIYSEKIPVGNESSLKLAELAFRLKQSSSEIQRINALLGK